MSHTMTFRLVQEGETTVLEPAATSGEADEEGTEAGHSTEAGTEEHAEEEVANPILPTSNELFWGALTFALLWALMRWVLLPPITKVQEERAAKVRADQEAAETAAADATALQQDYDTTMSGVRAEATRVIDDARHMADQARAEVMASAEAEIAADRARAASEVEAAKGVALDELRSGVGTLAVEAARAVVQRDIDAAAQQAVIDDYVRRAGAR